MLLVLDSMTECYENLASPEKFYDYLLALQERHNNLFLQEVIANIIEKIEGKQQAVEYLSDKIKYQPSLVGFQNLIAYKQKENDADEIFSNLTAALAAMKKDSAEYRCQKCGFSTNTHYWLCPGCNNWGRVKPSVVELGS